MVRTTVALVLLLAQPAVTAAQEESRNNVAGAIIVFYDAYGMGNSLVAAEWFNRLAKERGLPHRAVARGIRAAQHVPPDIVKLLGEDGFDVRREAPRELTPADVKRATRIVALDVDLPAANRPAAGGFEKWEGIPPTVKEYPAARDVLRKRIANLLTRLAKPAAR